MGGLGSGRPSGSGRDKVEACRKRGCPAAGELAPAMAANDSAVSSGHSGRRPRRRDSRPPGACLVLAVEFGRVSAGRLSMCARRHAGRLWCSWARQRHGAMPVTLLGARRRPRGDLTTKNNQSRYHENNYRRHNRHEGIPRLDCAFYGGTGFDQDPSYRAFWRTRRSVGASSPVRQQGGHRRARDDHLSNSSKLRQSLARRVNEW